mgnify:CR=1 FL=1
MKPCEVCGKPGTCRTGQEETGLWRFRYLCKAHSEKWGCWPKKEIMGPSGRFRPKVWHVIFDRFVAAEKEKL